MLFEGVSFKLDYLTKPSLFQDFGFVNKVKMADRVQPNDEIFIAAYPYFNVNGKPRDLIILQSYSHVLFFEKFGILS